MASTSILETVHFVKGIDPVADFNDGTTGVTDIVNMAGYRKCVFLYIKGVGTTGTSTLTVEACDDVVPTNTSAVPFMYRRCCNASTDIENAMVAATATGFTTTAGSSEMYVLEVDAEALAASGYGYVRLKAVEVVNSPVLGTVVIMLWNPRFAQAIKPTAVV